MSRLIVKNLPKTITEEKIRKLFSQKGEITDVQLKYTNDGKFRQFCFIGYRTEDEANEAIKFFNNSCIQTNKITVENCVPLGDSSKTKAWSKYSVESSAFKNIHKNENKNEINSTTKEETKEPHKSKIKELFEKYKNDVMFEEFMQLHGTKNVKTLINTLEETENNLEENELNNDFNKNLSEEPKEKAANQKISDLEYMKLLMKKSKINEKVSTETKKNNLKLYTIKLKGLPYTCKKKDIKQFLTPLVPLSIRFPQKVKGFAYVTFKTEKKMKQALNKDRSFLDGRRILVIEYNSNKDKLEETETHESSVKKKWIAQEDSLKNEEDIAESGRIFLRNLPYTVTEKEIVDLFEKYGPITEVSLPIDKDTRKIKGFGYVTFLMPENAVEAYSHLDGSILQGRMLHLLPSKENNSAKPIDTENMSYKQKKALKDKREAGYSHNWNSLFINHNAVANIISDTYGASKEQILDGKGKGSAAVRLALGETQIVMETKQFLEEHGVQLDAFNQPCTNRSKTVILVKNLPAHADASEIRELFSSFGILGRIVLPPSGTTALVEFLEPYEARQAFSKLAYKPFHNVPLYLEWAPENTFTAVVTKNSKPNKNGDDIKELSVNTSENDVNKEKKDDEVKQNDEEEDLEPEPNTTLFIKNISFDTTEESLRKHFESCGKINYITIATKKCSKTPEKKLSMGYGFIRFQHQASANKALKSLQMSTLDGKSLELKRSERTLKNEIESTRKKTKITKQTGTKILVKNVPFQAKSSELLEIFKAFGEIKSLRLPKKITIGPEAHRGFAFVDYVSKSDAKQAFEALSQSTHLYGRRLVLEWAVVEEDVEDIRKRTAKHFHQSEPLKNKKSTLDVDLFVSS